MENRAPSKHIVAIFDPNNDPYIAKLLKDEQRLYPKAGIVAIRTGTTHGLVTVNGKVFCVNKNGVGSHFPLDPRKVDIHSYHVYANGNLSATPCVTGEFSLKDCQDCLTGETLRLDEFVDQGATQDKNFAVWEKLLNNELPPA